MILAAAGRQGWPQATRGGRRPPWREQRDPGGAVVGFKVPLVTLLVPLKMPKTGSFQRQKNAAQNRHRKKNFFDIILRTPIEI